MSASNRSASDGARSKITLVRNLGLLALVATAVCNVIGAGINYLTLDIQQKVPGIGPYVPLAFIIGVFPALFTALCYAVLASAMPRAGGGYIYVSRALHPFLGFMATFSKWFGLAAAIGIIAYLDVGLLAAGLGYLDTYLNVEGTVSFLNSTTAKFVIPIAMIWIFWLVNILGVRTYAWTVIVLMMLMLAGGLAVVVTGSLTTPDQYATAFDRSPGTAITDVLDKAEKKQREEDPGRPFPRDFRGIQARASSKPQPFTSLPLAVAWLFFAYIGFAGISQAGGEARDARRILPRAFLIATAVICGYYLLFSWAVYHAFGWQFVAGFVDVAGGNASVPLLLGIVMHPALAAFIALMAALALANDIPPMLLATSRLFFAWARDGVFPKGLAAINPRFHSPHWALTACALVATSFVVACSLSKSYTNVIDIVVFALTFTYLLVAISVLTLPRRNPRIAAHVSFLRSRRAQIAVALLAILFLVPLLAAVPFLKGPGATVLLWSAVMSVGAVIFIIMWRRAKTAGVNLGQTFATLPTTAEDVETSPEVI